jgi:hypothetical protein
MLTHPAREDNMKIDRLNGSCWLSVVGCWRNTKGLSFSNLPTLALVIALTLLINLPCHSQQRWERNYGGTDDDAGYSVQQTQDGGYIVAGATYSFGNNWQVYLVKTNAFGDILWTRNYGGTGDDQGWSVQQTQDGGYIVAGSTSSFGNFYQVYLIKTNATGDTLWTRNYGGASWDLGYSVQQTQDSGYIVAGETNSFGNGGQVFLIKTNASGDTLWTRSHGGADSDGGRSVQQTSDGGFIVAGYTGYGGYFEVYLIKTNTSGDTLWTRNYGGTDSDLGYSVQQTQDSGYVVAGRTFSFGDSAQVYLVKIDTFGDTLWTKTYGGAGYDLGYSVQQTQDSGYIVAGGTNSFGNNAQVYLIKTNSSGDTLWTRIHGGTGQSWGYSVQQTSDGGYIVAGYTSSFGNRVQVYLIKTDANGSSGVEETAGVRGQRLEVRMTVKPNPFTSFAVVPGQEKETFELYDIAGRKAGTYRGDRIGWDTGPGVYFLRKAGKTSVPIRVVKVK